MSGTRRSGAWTTLELERIRRLFPTVAARALARRLRRSEAAIRDRARIIFGRRPNRSAWTDEDDRRLATSYGLIPLADLALVLSRSQRDIQLRVRRLRSEVQPRSWTHADDRTLKRWYGGRPVAALEVCLRRPADDIEARARLLRLGRDKRVPAEGPRRMPRWTAADVARLRSLYPASDTVEIAAALGRSASSVVNKASQLGLTKGAAKRSATGRQNVSRRWS